MPARTPEEIDSLFAQALNAGNLDVLVGLYEPQASLMPTGGVTLENVGEWIRAGSVAIGVGSNLTAGAKTGDFAAITQLAQKFVAKIKEARA